MTITEARANLLDVATQFEDPSAQPVEVTKRGKPVMTLVPTATYEALLETVEILADDEAMAGIRRGLADIEAGKTIPLETLRRKLGL